MPTDFLIVSRTQRGLYDYLLDDFASDDSVHVIMDRRVSERRRMRASVTQDRRQSERRVRSDIGEKLHSIGFAIVRVEDGRRHGERAGGDERR